MQKWQTELYSTPLWLLQTLLIVSAASAVILFLTRKTRCGREFAYILRLCLTPKSAVKVLLLITAMVTLMLTEVRLNVLSTFMSKGLYDSMQEMRRHAPDNIDQRIQQDAQEFIASTIEFVRGMVNSVVTSLEFAVVLWGLAGILTVFGFDIPHGIVWFVYIFVILATFIAMWIGNPLIRYNYENEKLNGDYRYSLIRVRDHAESVAFYNGEQHEHGRLSDRFKAIIRNRWRIARQSVCLSGFNDMFTNGIKLFPIILQAPRLFAGQIKIGDIQQTVQAFARLQNALSFFRMFYNKFTAYRARLERLYGFLLSTEEQHSARQPEISEVSDGIALECKAAAAFARIGGSFCTAEA